MKLKSYSVFKKKKEKKKRRSFGEYVDALIGIAFVSETANLIKKI